MENPRFLEEDPKKKALAPQEDISIDLTAPDAIERLDRVHDELGARQEAGEDPITSEDEQAETEHDAEMSRDRDEMNLEEMRFWRGKACRDAGDEIDVMRSAGYPEKELLRIAEKMAADIVKEEERLNALRREKGLRVTEPSATETLMHDIMARANEMRSERPPSQQGTAVLDLIEKPEKEVDDDDTAV